VVLNLLDSKKEEKQQVKLSFQKHNITSALSHYQNQLQIKKDFEGKAVCSRGKRGYLLFYQN